MFASNDSSIAVYAIDQQTGEPTLIETAVCAGRAHAHVLVRRQREHPGGGKPGPDRGAPRRQGNVIPAALSVFRVGQDGKLTFVRKYDVDTGTNLTQWWSGMVPMA